MKRILILVLLISFLVSACSNHNSAIQGDSDSSTAAKDESQTEKRIADSMDPNLPEQLPPAKGGIMPEPLPPAKKEDRYTVKYDTKKYEIEKAISRTIEYYNDNKSPNEIPFPNTIKPGETISKEIELKGDFKDSTKLEVTAKAQKEGSKYTVTLTKDWNVKVNKVQAVSYWKYEVSDNGAVKLVETKDDGKPVEKKASLGSF